MRRALWRRRRSVPVDGDCRMKLQFHGRGRRAERGAALVELVVTLPVLLVLLVGTADFARVFYLAIALTNAARAGAQFGAKSEGASNLLADIKTAAESSVNISGVTATVLPPVCQCALANGTFPDTVSCSTPPATACPSASGKFRVITVTVSASAPFFTI